MLLVKIKNLMKSISYEPVMLLYFTSMALSLLSAQNLLLHKACYPGDSAPEPTAICRNEIEAQKIVTDIQSWQNLIILFGPILFVMFAGAWSDNHGKRRKPLMWLPICGQILSDCFCIVNVYFWSWSPTVAALSQSIPTALTGWRSCFIIGVISYISDISSRETRTVRTGVFSALYFIGGPIGSTLFGMLFDSIGFFGVFLIPVLLNLTGLVYLVMFLPDSDPKTLKECKLKVWEGLCDPRQLIQSMKTLFKPRKGYLRTVLLLTILAAPLTMAPLQGEYTIMLLFVRYQFHWTEVQYSYYTAYKCVVIFCGTLITTRIFSRLLGFPDAVIGMMACVTLILASFGFTFATASWELFFYPVLDFMQGAGMAVVYSIVSKSVEDVELGQVNSIVGVLDAVYPLVNLPIYNQVYNRTFAQLTGAVFLLSAFYGVIAFFVFGLVLFFQKIERLPEKKKEPP